MVMITAAIGLASRWFGAKRADSGDDVQGDDPIVCALFKAVNDGEIDDLLELVSEDCRVTLVRSRPNSAGLDSRTQPHADGGGFDA